MLAKGTARIDDVDAFVADLEAVGNAYGCAVQAFDARYVAGREHLERAVRLANRAVERGENVAHDRSVEILLYAAGTRQIDRAFELGVREGTGPVVVVVDGENETSAVEAVRTHLDSTETRADARDETVLLDFFEITEAERAATSANLTDLVCERVALLEVEK